MRDFPTSDIFDITNKDLVIPPRRERVKDGVRPSKIMSVYCTVEEYEYIKELAKTHHLPVSHFIKILAFNTKQGKYNDTEG